MRYLIFIGAISLLFLPTSGLTETIEEKKFIAAKKALNRGELLEFEILKQELSQHHLIAYLDYYYINNNFETIDIEVIDSYIDKYPNSPMANKLLKRKLLNYAIQKDWNKFLENYKSSINNTELSCYYAMALQASNRSEEAAALLKSLWLKGKNMPDACTGPFDAWLAVNPDKEKLIWQRFELALKNYDFGLAKYLTTRMSALQEQEATAILQLYDNPNLITKTSYLNQQPSAEVVSYGLSRLARRDPNYAIKIYNKLSKLYVFNDRQKQRVFQAIALKFALRKNPQSSIWFRKMIGFKLDDVYQEWMIRSALYHNDWLLVKNAIEAMPEQEKTLPQWRYWHARALQQLGHTTKAQTIFSELAKERSYHGFLASQNVKNAINVKHQPLEISEDEINAISNSLAYKRAKSLYELNQKDEARLELYYLIISLEAKHQYVLIKLVSNWEWHPQVLRLSHYSELKDDVNLRFPLAFFNAIIKNSEKHNVDPALVYAIMRQESYFMEKANSHAGAVGLMQLMPATAHLTSRQYNLKYSGQEDLLKGETNIEFGTAHLNQLHKQFDDHPILIIAAYNAGKDAVKRWLPKGKGVAADVWVETVPFKETRNYLKQVIAGYIVYQFRLGEQPDLKKIMKNIY